MRVKFTETRVVDDHRKGTPDEERYEAGKVYNLPEPSARRWINRKAAIEIGGEESQAASARDDLPVAPKRVMAGKAKV